MSYDREKCERLMKVCQKGYPASNIHVEYANNTLAECYGAIGAMMLEIDRLQKDAERYRHLRSGNCSGHEEEPATVMTDDQSAYYREDLDKLIDKQMAAFIEWEAQS